MGMTPQIARVVTAVLSHIALALAFGRDHVARDRALHSFEAVQRGRRKIRARGGRTNSLFRHQFTLPENIPHGRSTPLSAISTPSSIWVAAIDISREPNRSAST